MANKLERRRMRLEAEISAAECGVMLEPDPNPGIVIPLTFTTAYLSGLALIGISDILQNPGCINTAIDYIKSAF